MPTRWEAWRAGCIAGVIAVQCVDAVPLPEVSRRDLRWPVAQTELRRWTQIVNDMGWGVRQDELADHVVEIGEGATALRKALLRPTHALRSWTGTGQAWGLFAYPDVWAGRLVVEARADESVEELVYRAPGQGERWIVDLLEYRRVRGIYDDAGDRPRPKSMYRAWTRWLGRHLMTRNPHWDEVTVRLDLVRIHLPDEGPEPDDLPRHTRVERRDELMQ